VTARTADIRWSGIHFRTADVVAAQIGAQVSSWAMSHYFKSTRESKSDD